MRAGASNDEDPKVSAGTQQDRKLAAMTAAVAALRDTRTAIPALGVAPAGEGAASAVPAAPALGACRNGHESPFVHLPSAKNLQGILLVSERVCEGDRDLPPRSLSGFRPLGGEADRSLDFPFRCLYGQSLPRLHSPVWNAMQ